MGQFFLVFVYAKSNLVIPLNLIVRIHITIGHNIYLTDELSRYSVHR